MEKIILFHGNLDRIVVPTFGKGEEKHDYGQGFYLSESIDLAKEWAVWRANASYFYIAKEFVKDNIDMDILEELLSLEERYPITMNMSGTEFVRLWYMKACWLNFRRIRIERSTQRYRRSSIGRMCGEGSNLGYGIIYERHGSLRYGEVERA